MIRTSIITLHIKDAVDKTFHISENEILMHVGDSEEAIKVSEKYRDPLINLSTLARDKADETTVFVDYSVRGDINGIGDVAQKIWEATITE